jgi:hypothetical protein
MQVYTRGGGQLNGMRVLAVVSDELLGADDARDWAFLESLVAVNSPASIEVEVLALINQPAASIATANPLERAVGRMATAQNQPVNHTTRPKAPACGWTAPCSTCGRSAWAPRRHRARR